MKRLAVLSLVFSFAFLATLARADEKANPTGTWKWTVMFGQRSRDMTLKLKQEGDKLTGAMIGRNNQETPIEDGKFENGTVSFKVTRERNGQKFTTSYSGKVKGDTIKGKMEFERNGETRSRDWEAKRAKSSS